MLEAVQNKHRKNACAYRYFKLRKIRQRRVYTYTYTLRKSLSAIQERVSWWSTCMIPKHNDKRSQTLIQFYTTKRARFFQTEVDLSLLIRLNYQKKSEYSVIPEVVHFTACPGLMCYDHTYTMYLYDPIWNKLLPLQLTSREKKCQPLKLYTWSHFIGIYTFHTIME